MPCYVKVGEVYKPWVKVWQKVNGEWKLTPNWYIKRGTWKLIHTTRHPFYFSKTLTTQANYNLYTDLVANGWNKEDYVVAEVTVPAGVIITSLNSQAYAFSTGFNFPRDSSLTLVVDGVIQGRGGDGGQGGGSNDTASSGRNGGPAVFTSIPTALRGNGLISGGGGGGGGGASVRGRPWTASSWRYSTGLGGGGGAGAGGGVGGLTSSYVDPDGFGILVDAAPGYSSSLEAPGAGGYPGGYLVIADSQVFGGAGGAGGMFSSGEAGGEVNLFRAYYITGWPSGSGGWGGAAFGGYALIDPADFSGNIRGARE